MLKKVPIILAIVVLGLDLTVKYWVKNNITLEASIKLWSNLTLHYNGVIETALIYRFIITAITVFSIFIIFWRKQWISMPLGPLYFIISGIIGNQIYNIKIAETVRWIPRFNIADCCIVISTLVMLILLMSDKKIR